MLPYQLPHQIQMTPSMRKKIGYVIMLSFTLLVRVMIVPVL